ncbi:MAG: hypothetical protein ACJ74O_12305 [Frankiaceae bacterium]
MHAMTMTLQPATLGGPIGARWATRQHLPVRLAPVAAGAKGTGLPMSGPAVRFAGATLAPTCAIQTALRTAIQTIDLSAAAPNGVADAGLRTLRRPPV